VRNILIFFGVIIALSVLGCDLLAVNVRYQIDFSSRYIWRGFDLNPYKKPVIQPSLDLEWGQSGFSVNLWSSISFVDKEINEFDLTLTYGRKITKDLSAAVGLIHYAWYLTPNFTFKDDTSHEIFVSLILPDFFLNPALTLFYDFTTGDGFYGQADIGRSFPLFKSLEAGLYASLGYNGGQWLAEGVAPGFSDFNLGLSLSKDIGRFRAAAFANYTFVLLDAIGREDHFWFGFSLGYQGKERKE
jgi:uncharacterized protein (TIGR02001 family)